MINNKLLEPFNLKFPIYAGNPGYYFISNPLNYNLHTQLEQVDLSEWVVDSVIDVYIEQEYHWETTPILKRVYQTSPKIYLRYQYDTKNYKLKIFWGNIQPKNQSVLVIKFYSVSQQREKTLNQLFNDELEA